MIYISQVLKDDSWDKGLSCVFSVRSVLVLTKSTYFVRILKEEFVRIFAKNHYLLPGQRETPIQKEWERSSKILKRV